MLSSFIALVFTAFTLTASGATERPLEGVAVAAQVTSGAEVVKTSLRRPAPAPAAAHAVAVAAPAAAAAAADAPTPHEVPREVSFEMLLAALGLMGVVALRRYRSGPR